jgi:hypothetical protein
MHCTDIPSDKSFRDEEYFGNGHRGGECPQANDMYQKACVDFSLFGCPLGDARTESGWTALPLYSLNMRRITYESVTNKQYDVTRAQTDL